MSEEQWKARILVNMTFLVRRLNERTSKVVFLTQETLSEEEKDKEKGKDKDKDKEEEEVGLPFDGVLYFLPPTLSSFSPKELDEGVEMFEEFVRFVGGLEGKCLAIWVDVDDWMMKDTMADKFRLKERDCEWCWDYGKDGERDEDVSIRLCNFFEENNFAQHSLIKPAKRGE